MAHSSAPIDEEVWLTQEDVAKGEDTVVKAAMAWIKSITDVSSGKNNTSAEFSLSQNYPNPFNPATNIEYQISGNDSQLINVKIKIYNILGEELFELVNKNQSAGNYSVKFNASGLSSGIYIYTLYAGNYSISKKMALLK
jgi:hypothetical protein